MGTDVARSAAQDSPLRDGSRRRKRRGRWIVLVVLVVLLGIAVSYVRFDLRSYALLTRFADPSASGPLLRFETHDVTSEDVTIATPSGPLRARLFLPVGVAHPQGMVAVHGIHHLGMDEPRLMSFARAVAGTGLAVLTPQIDALADYHVDASSIADIGESAVWLDDRLGDHKVTLTGISFAGGLSLLAASDPRYAPHIRALVLMGAYDDLARVSRFLATSQEELPDGSAIPYAAHDYGASVFVYAHLAQFFPVADLPIAHDALRYWLWEQPEKALPLLDKLSPPSRATMDALLNRRISEVRPRILSEIQMDTLELEAISPSRKLASLRVPVFVLHGSADNIIPPAESLWMEKDIPREDLREVLITEAFSHVDPAKGASLTEKLRLVRFVAGVLRAAD
jgi:pimeloyl-ACP methyl ester carboxylesterase